MVTAPWAEALPIRSHMVTKSDITIKHSMIFPPVIHSMDHGMPSSVVDAMPMVDAAMPSHAGARWRVWTRCGGALVARERVARRRTDPRPLSAACPARRPPHSRPRPRDAAMECTARRVHRPAAFMRPHWLAGQHPPFGPPPSRLRRGSDDT